MSSLKGIMLVISLFIYSYSIAQNKGQTELPEVGKPCPDFVFNNIQHYLKNKAGIKDFRGKWLILDCWNQYCIGCVKSFPKTNKLQQEFGDKVQFLLIGDTNAGDGYDYKSTRALFEKCREKLNLQLAVAYDSTFLNRFSIGGSPNIIIIDPEGIIRGMANTISEEQIASFLEGGQPVLAHNLEIKKWPSFNFDQLFLINGNGGNDTDFLYRSVLAKWDSSKQPILNVGGFSLLQTSFQVLGMDISTLYQYAYIGMATIDPGNPLYGKLYEFPLMEVKDSLSFMADDSTAKNRYSYSLNLPFKVSRERMMKMMQRDLQNYFGYKAEFEIRKMPYWRLVATKWGKAKLRTKGGNPYYQAADQNPNKVNPSFAGFTIRNYPIQFLVNYLGESIKMGETIINATGINGNIDITLHALMFDLKDVRHALRKQGLDLIRGEKDMKVLVISDKDTGH